MSKSVLIVDDDKKIANLIEFRLKHQGYSTHCAYRGQEAIDYADKQRPGLVMLDIRLPDIDGVEVLKTLRKKQDAVEVIMISGQGDIKSAVECMKLGASDFLQKPFELTELDLKVKKIFEKYPLSSSDAIRQDLGEKYKFKSILGNSLEMRRVFEQMTMAAGSNANVLIEGESGTGKELVARAIHFNSAQKEGPFVAVNCGAIPENLLESELFGHEKGSFTGAAIRKIGRFEQASGGTIFLDEIGDLSPQLQVKLLRVLQEREIERVGSNEAIPIQVRFISATHQDLKKLIREDKFREDLYFRVNVFPIRLPPLRERREDIPELFKYFVSKQERGERPVKIESRALEKLMEYHWPGNIRELENFVERIMLLKGDRKIITESDLNFLDDLKQELPLHQTQNLGDAAKVMGDTEKAILENALKKANGNVSHASKLLNISRDTFYRKIKKHAIGRY